MMMTLIICAVSLFCASVVQAAVGFAFGLVAIPVMILAGVPLPQAMATVSTAMVMQATMSITILRSEWEIRSYSGPLAVAMLAMLAGVWTLKAITGIDPRAVRGLVGLTLLAALLMFVLIRPRPRHVLHRSWAYLAYGSSGYIIGLAGMGGPTLVLWTMAHDWPPTRTRLVLWTSFVVLVSVQIVILVLGFGAPVLRAALLGVALFPVVFLGTRTGMAVGARMSKTVLRQVTELILLVLAVWSVLSWLAGA